MRRIGPISTHHEIHNGPTRLAYTATFAEMPLTDETGGVQATISSTSYVLSAKVAV